MDLDKPVDPQENSRPRLPAIDEQALGSLNEMSLHEKEPEHQSDQEMVDSEATKQNEQTEPTIAQQQGEFTFILLFPASFKFPRIE